MKRWMIRGLLLAVALGMGGFLVAASGVIPIGASSGHWAITEWALRFGMKRSTATHSLGIEVPTNLGDARLIRQGASHYEFGCRSCHGEPGRPQPLIAARMLPPPADLKPSVLESDAKKLFTIVKHGVKFTGMPAWPAQQRDDEVWAVVAFLLKYPELDQASYRALVGAEPVSVAPIEGMTAERQALVSRRQFCGRCHEGGTATGNETVFPSLAGQRLDYLRNALEAYATGRRHSGTMGAIALALTAEERRMISEDYARMRPSATPAGAAVNGGADPAAIARGRAIAWEGIREQRVPSCVECHGPEAKRGKPAYPWLAGLPAGYVRLQLQLFKDGQRGGSEFAHLMQPVATRLSDEQANDVALYFESLARPAAAP